MTKAQIMLLKKCIIMGDDCVEVGWINGVNPRTAEALVDTGIITYDWPVSYNGDGRTGYVRLLHPDELE